MTPRGEILGAVLVDVSRTIEDPDRRARALHATLDAIRLEGTGVDSLDEWAARLNSYAAHLVLARRVDEARMLAAAARILAV
jgi:hypothetical protein